MDGLLQNVHDKFWHRLTVGQNKIRQSIRLRMCLQTYNFEFAFKNYIKKIGLHDMQLPA